MSLAESLVYTDSDQSKHNWNNGASKGNLSQLPRPDFLSLDLIVQATWAVWVIYSENQYMLREKAE